jgi:hypothetical protein
MSNLNQQRIYSRDLVLAIWRAIEWDRISPTRRKNIYNELASKVKSAAMTNSLESFVESLARKMGCKTVDPNGLLETIASADKDVVLSLLRDETQIIIAMLREHQEIKKQRKELGLQ